MKKKRFAFIGAAFEFTQTWFPVTQRLAKDGCEAFFICHRPSEYDWLREQGVPEKNLLKAYSHNDFDFTGIDIPGRLSALEKYGPPLVNDILIMDRFMYRYGTDYCYRYLAFLDIQLTKFLSENEISFVTGGHDNALQIMTLLVCRKLNILWAMATSTRLPKERFGFITDSHHSAFLPLRPVDKDAEAFAQTFIETYRTHRLKPDYVHFQDSWFALLKTFPAYLKKFATNLYYSFKDSEKAMSWYTNTQLVQMYFRRRFNAIRLKWTRPFETPRDEKFVLYALQVQPESSIDVIASFYSDQLSLIKQIRKATPADYQVYVKAHPGDIGQRGPKFFKEIKKIVGVRLIEPHLNSLDLIRKASLVLSPSGTISFEAGLWGTPSIVFCPVFFHKFPTVRYCNSQESLYRYIHEALREKPDAEEVQRKTDAFLKDLHANSVQGQFDAFFHPFTPEELDTLSFAYLKVFEHCEKTQ